MIRFVGKRTAAKKPEAAMRIDLLTREYPPHVYGGAGVHVTELSRVLARHADIHVRAFDGPRTPAQNKDVPAGVALQGLSLIHI